MNFLQLQYPLSLVLLLLILRCEHSYSSQLNNTNRIRCLERERQALLDIKGELVDIHGRLSSWGNEENKRDCCKWKGVHCHNRSNHVTRLVLNYIRRGKISTSLLELQHLRYLDLSINDFEYAPIPEFIGSLTKLRHLNLHGANFGGSIPHQIGNLSKLHSLDISYNQCYSLNLDWLFSLGSLEYLHLSGTNLSKATNCTILTSIDLSYNSMVGSIPNDFENMMSLQYLSLQGNDLQSGIPKHFGNLSSLTILVLSDNNLSGDISKFSPSWVPRFKLELLFLAECKLGKYFPKWLETQKELSQIDISSTGISDIIPSWFGSIPNFSLPPDSEPEGIVMLDISKNMISGSLNFLCDVKESGYLDLSDNLFSGQIPDCFANFQNLACLSLANNHLYGKIPHSFGQLNALALLHLRNNSLSGGIPTTMRNCRGLKMIDVGGNKLTGTIPSWIGDSFPELIVLVLRSNEFYGDIPSNICRLANLQILDMSSNKNISGTIPKCLQDYVAMSTEQSLDNEDLFFPRNFFTQEGLESIESAFFMWKGKELKYTSHLGLVKLIDFSNNGLIGEIPSNVTKLTGLVSFNISNNNLVGPIPPHIGEMKSLNSLDFSRNHLSGGIPTSICDLDSLGRLDLSYNNLSGRIPQDNHCLTFGGPTYIGNVGLCGPLLNKSCPGDEPIQDPNSTVDAQGEFDDDDGDRFITRGFYIALALGFIIGFWGIYGTILLDKTFRYAVFNKFNVIGDFVCLRIELSKARFWRFFQTR
ncbi:UNVERIFIED_CONTAM: Receptor-like protein EIX1 [Sesamum calycinum]|uniref:Receptor-like protein EIX1 n=1 Tax=Sesamum calycinum TaxID=2727403 RepID=A0AAW2QVL9_9LAMI